MKRTISILIAALMILTVVSLCPVMSAGAADTNDFGYFVLQDGTASILGYSGSDADVTIPSEIDGYKVTGIAYQSFANRTSIRSVTIPDTVTDINSNAFDGCSSLEKITVEGSLKSVGSYAFHGTAWYDSQPDGLVYIGGAAYSMKGPCPENVTIEKGTTCIADSAFDMCADLKHVEIPDTVTRIGNNAFSDCVYLESIEIPGKVTSIGEYAFVSCVRLKSVEIPDSVKRIGSYAFDHCTALTKITISDSVTSIGEKAFGYQFGQKIDGVTIYCYKDSAAYEYAKNNGFQIKLIHRWWKIALGILAAVVLAAIVVYGVITYRRKKQAAAVKKPDDPPVIAAEEENADTEE